MSHLSINKTNIQVLLFCIILVGFHSCTSTGSDNHVSLQEDTTFLQIPGVGWQTFNRVANEDRSMDGLRFKSGSAYYRWYWVTLEPQEGQYAFGMIDSLLARCRENGQALAFRVMCEDPWGEGLPQWLIRKGIKRTYSPCPEEGAHYTPDLSDPVFSRYHEKLIRALGERYDGHPDIALLDIGSVGLWGEWHIYCDTALMPDPAVRRKITDLYLECFPNTPLTSLMNDAVNTNYAVGMGRCGWRGDSWGDADSTGGSWNHHQYYYWPTHNRLPEAWKTGTVAMEPGEPGGTLNGITVPVKRIVDDAIAWHATFAHNKSKAIPTEQISEIERLVKKMGFRIVLRNMKFEDVVNAGSEMPFEMKFENTGIAPPYRDYRIAFRVRDKNNEFFGTALTDLSIIGWLPGEKITSSVFKIPSDVKPGKYELEIGLALYNSIDHTIPLANYGRTADGWYSAGTIRIKKQ